MMTRLLYASDFHGSEAFFRKFISAAFQYQANVLIVGGDVTGKAMIPIVHQGKGRFIGYLFGRKEEPDSPEALERLKRTINNVGFYPIVLEPDEARDLENNPDKMGKRFEQEMCRRVREWLTLAEEKLRPRKISLFFMPGNDDLASIDKVIDEFEYVHNPDGKRFWIDDDHELVGLSNANMTPWRCARDIEEDELERKLEQIGALLEFPTRAVADIHVPPFASGIDVCPQLDKDLRIMTEGGQVLMKPVGSPSVRCFLEKYQPLLSLHGHIHEAAGYVRIGRTLAINAGSEYAEGIMKAAIINLEKDRVKGHLLVSG
ncbi:MAG: metallophosphoesterase [Chloroflexi bacterium]|nr:metallophosphoesterase [Chloroflexota bacterium]